jgi:hypothetical protein
MDRTFMAECAVFVIVLILMLAATKKLRGSHRGN